MAGRLLTVGACLVAGGGFFAANFMEFIDHQPVIVPWRMALAIVFFGLAIWLAFRRPARR